MCKPTCALKGLGKSKFIIELTSTQLILVNSKSNKACFHIIYLCHGIHYNERFSPMREFKKKGFSEMAQSRMKDSLQWVNFNMKGSLSNLRTL